MAVLCTILRRTFYTAAAVSTLLLLATLILWPATHYRGMQAMFVDPKNGNYSLNAGHGRVGFSYSSWPNPGSGWRFWTGDEIGPASVDHWGYLTWDQDGPLLGGVPCGSTTLGVLWGKYVDPSGLRRLPNLAFLYLPFSYLALLFAVLPLLALRSIRRRRRASRIGLCPKCGYDLRATVPAQAAMLARNVEPRSPNYPRMEIPGLGVHNQ